MTDTSLPDGIVLPQDKGTGLAAGERTDKDSAGHVALLAQHVQGTYVGAGCGFTTIDTSNDTADVAAGHAFIEIDDVTVVSGGGTEYDTTLPDPAIMCIVVPSAVTLDLDTAAVNDVWLALDPTTTDGAYLRHGSGETAPSDPHVKLGTIDTSDGSTTRASDDVPLQKDVDAGGRAIRNAGSIEGQSATVGSVSTDEVSITLTLLSPPDQL